MGSKSKIEIGQKYGKWVVKERISGSSYLCQCNCSLKTERVICKSDLINGKTTKCSHCSSNTYVLHEDFVECYTKKGEKFLIDLEDLELVQTTTWSINYRGYVVGCIGKVSEKLHRVIMSRHYGALDSNYHIDHINQDKSDNRKSNLRVVTSSINQQNTKIPNHNTSGIKGVSWYKKYEKWCAYITRNKKRIFLGYYDSIEEAVEARREGERLYHSETHYLMADTDATLHEERTGGIGSSNR